MTRVQSVRPNVCHQPTPAIPRTRGVEDAAPYGWARNEGISIVVNKCVNAANLRPPLGSPERGAEGVGGGGYPCAFVYHDADTMVFLPPLTGGLYTLHCGIQRKGAARAPFVRRTDAVHPPRRRHPLRRIGEVPPAPAAAEAVRKILGFFAFSLAHITFRC